MAASQMFESCYQKGWLDKLLEILTNTGRCMQCILFLALEGACEFFFPTVSEM